MSMVTVVVPPAIRQFVGGQTRVPVNATTVREALEGLASGSDTLHSRLFDRTNSINRFVRVFVDGQPTTGGAAGEDSISEGAVVTILLALAGG
jgi:molybdopterin synthase sulfur carrier subunit